MTNNAIRIAVVIKTTMVTRMRLRTVCLRSHSRLRKKKELLLCKVWVLSLRWRFRSSLVKKILAFPRTATEPVVSMHVAYVLPPWDWWLLPDKLTKELNALVKNNLVFASWSPKQVTSLKTFQLFEWEGVPLLPTPTFHEFVNATKTF